MKKILAWAVLLIVVTMLGLTLCGCGKDRYAEWYYTVRVGHVWTLPEHVIAGDKPPQLEYEDEHVVKYVLMHPQYYYTSNANIWVTIRNDTIVAIWSK